MWLPLMQRLWFFIAAQVLVCLTGVQATILLKPLNTAVVSGSDVLLQASSSGGPNNVEWSCEGLFNSQKCGRVESFYNITCSDNVSVLTTFKVNQSLSCSCVDSSEAGSRPPTYRAAIVLISQEPTCGLPNSTVVLQGQNVTLPANASFERDVYYSIGTTSAWILDGVTVLGSMSVGSYNMLTVVASGTVVPSYVCQFNVSVTWIVPNANDNRDIIVTRRSAPILIQYCPTSVNITPALPSSGQILAGSTLTCLSDGYKTPTIVLKETVSGSTASGSSFTLSPNGDIFLLTCTAVGNVFNRVCKNITSNITGFAIVCPSNVTITQEQTNQVIRSGDSIQVRLGERFSCSANSLPNSTYYWAVNGTFVYPSSRFYVANVTGTFSLSCRASVDSTSLCSDNQTVTITVNVIDCPHNVAIVNPARSSQLIVNGSLIQAKLGEKLTCSATSSPTATISWITSGSSTFNQADFTLNSVGSPKLTCRASLGNYTQVCDSPIVTITVDIQDCPRNVTITDVTRSRLVAANDSISMKVGDILSCSAISSPNSTYSWSSTSDASTNGSTYTLTTPGSPVITCQASIPGSQVCNASTTNVKVFTVDCPPNATIINQPGTKTYTCNVTTVATPSFSWVDSVTSPSSATFRSNGLSYTLSTSIPGNHTLTCSATVSVSPVFCPTVNTSVIVPIIECPNVSIISSTGSQTVAHQTTFNCSTTGGFPEPTYQWLNGTTILNSTQTYSVTAAGFYQLTCVATSTAGSDSCSTNSTVSGFAIGLSTTMPTTMPTTMSTTLNVNISAVTAVTAVNSTGIINTVSSPTDGVNNGSTAPTNNNGSTSLNNTSGNTAAPFPNGTTTISSGTNTNLNGSITPTTNSSGGGQSQLTTPAGNSSSLNTSSAAPGNNQSTPTNASPNGNQSFIPTVDFNNTITPTAAVSTTTQSDIIVTIVAATVPAILGFASLILIAVGLYLLRDLLSNSAAILPAGRNAQPSSIPDRQPSIRRPDTNIGPSFYAPGYAFQGTPFVRGLGRF